MAGADLKVNWEGLDTLQATLRQLSPRASEFLRNELVTTAYEAFDKSQEQVPRDTGALAGSGNVNVVSAENPVTISVSYGGPAAGYAYWVHENLSARHKSPTKAKYLEDPVNAAVAQMPARMQARVEGAIMGQYGQEASVGQGKGDGGSARTHSSSHRTKAMASKKMNDEDIRHALRVIDADHRLRTHGIRTSVEFKGGKRVLPRRRRRTIRKEDVTK